jgi:hypothetical protein
MHPVNERRKPFNKKEKFATEDTSKHQKKCPICRAIYHMGTAGCPNCRYLHLYNEDMPGIVKASELDE